MPPLARPCTICGKASHGAAQKPTCRVCYKHTRQHRPPMPEPDPIIVEPAPECLVKIINGEEFPMCRTRIEGRQKFESHDPDCPVMHLFKLNLRCGQRAGV